MDRELLQVIVGVELQLRRVAYALEVGIRLKVDQGSGCRVCVACGCSIVASTVTACPVCGQPSKEA